MTDVTDKMVEAAKKSAQQFWRDTSNFDRHMRKVLATALSTRPAQEPVAVAAAWHDGITYDRIERMMVAVEGECEGLAIDAGQAMAILAHVFAPTALSSQRGEDSTPSPVDHVEPVAWRLRWVYPSSGEPTSWTETGDPLVARQREADGWEVRALYEMPPPTGRMAMVDWENPDDPAVKLFVGFDVEGYVEEYELCGEGGDYSPNEHERVLLVDAIYGVVSNLHEDLRKIIPSKVPPASDVEGER